MTDRRVLVSADERRSRTMDPAPDFGWYLFGWVGLVFAVVGGVDIALTFMPTNFGNAEWEFGTVSATFDRLPLVTMGMAFMLGSGVARGTRWLVRTMAVVLAVGAVTIVLGGLLYATDVPLALRSAPDPVVALGLKRAVIKTASQAVLYPVAFAWIALRAWQKQKAKPAR